MATSSAGSSRPWTLRETALLFNHADECLRDSKIYKTTIEKRVLDTFGRITTYNAVEGKLYRALKKFARQPSVKDFLHQGTSCLGLSPLPDESKALVAEMNRQRLSLNLQELDEASSKLSGNDTASTGCAGTSSQKNPQATKPRGAKRTYRETSVSDSDSAKDDLNDAEYMGGDLLVEAIHPTKRPRKTKQPDVVGHQIAASGSVAPRPTRKGKEPARAVIDLHEESPPSPNTIDREETLRTSEALKAPAALQNYPLSQSNIASEFTRKRKAATEEETNRGSILSPPSKRLITHDISSASRTQHPPANRMIDHGNGVKSTPWALPRGMPESDRLVHLPPIETQVVTLHRELDDIRYLVFSLLQEHVITRKPLTEDMKRRLDNIKETMRQEPGTIVHDMLDHLDAANRGKRDLFEKFNSVLGYVNPAQPPTFPQEVVQKVDWDWQHLREGIKAIFRREDGPTVEGPLPSAHSAGYVASTIDDLLEDGKDRPTLFSKLQGHLESPGAAQSLMSALVCLWLFGASDPQCDGYHTDFIMKQYEIKALSDGLEEIQKLDKIGFSRVFADKSFQDVNMPRLADELVTRLFSVLKQACPAADYEGYFSREIWADGALKLKQKLSISPHDYRIHFCAPGTLYDPTWMQADDEEGMRLKEHEAKGKEIIMCLFPALVQQKPKPFEKDAPMADALVKNKNFFPSWEEKHNFDPKKVISKATVLVKYG